ncbi:hypothetical protein GWN63_02490, partial [Candidatus Bathyarchaeota archaeon]|nr:hypothetical protein [Candidatus Bathyarchaeota archaeon]NIU81099.1 hypothetical protein [Candidatus Bathyarchaeota archaeon]NIV67735.1 hypothetical protein [Candidatus Bathyarchaeota archaeon]
THQDNGTRFDAGLQVERILYIQDTLYTLSEKKVKMNNLGDLTVTREIELP